MSLASEQLSSEPSDAELIRRTRDGDSDAYGTLFARHSDAARGLAARLTSGTPVAADDVVSDAFIGVLSAIRSGHGPEESFRAYLYTAVRNGSAALRARESRSIAVEDPADFEKPRATPDPAVTAFESGVVQRAFGSLPERWQAVLWYAEVEEMKPAAIAPMLGVSPNGVSALLLRAREGLRDAYVGAHLREVGDARPECRWTAERLGGHARGTLARRDRRKVGSHLRDCPDCIVMAAEAREVERGLRVVIAPLVLGGAGAAWLATRPLAESAPTASGASVHGVRGSSRGGSVAGSTAAASRLTPGRVVALTAAGVVTAAMVAIAAVSVWGQDPEPPLAAPHEPAPEKPVVPPARDEPEQQEQPEEPVVVVDAGDDTSAQPPQSQPASPVEPPPADEPEEPEETAPVPVTMAQSPIVGRVTVIDGDNPVLAVSGTVASATVTWLADDALAASLISFTVSTGHYTLSADSVVEETLPGGAVRYVATADATGMAAAFSNDTWLIDDSFGPIDWRLEVVEAGPDTGGIRLDGPVALTAGQQVSVTLDVVGTGTGTAHITTLDGAAVTASVVDGVLLMQAAHDTIVQQVIVVFAP